MGLGQILLGVGGVLVGIKTIRDGLSGGGEEPVHETPDETVQGSGMTLRTHQVRNIDQRIGHIVKMIQKGRVHPTVLEFTREAVAQRCGDAWCTKERDYNAEVDAVFYQWRRHVRYVYDPYGVDLFQHPARTLQLRSADCDDYSIALCSSLQSIGYPVALRVIQTNDSDDWNHIYMLAGLPPHSPTVWKPLDASVEKPPGWQAPASMVKRYRDFPVP